MNDFHGDFEKSRKTIIGMWIAILVFMGGALCAIGWFLLKLAHLYLGR